MKRGNFRSADENPTGCQPCLPFRFSRRTPWSGAREQSSQYSPQAACRLILLCSRIISLYFFRIIPALPESSVMLLPPHSDIRCCSLASTYHLPSGRSYGSGLRSKKRSRSRPPISTVYRSLRSSVFRDRALIIFFTRSTAYFRPSVQKMDWGSIIPSLLNSARTEIYCFRHIRTHQPYSSSQAHSSSNSSSHSSSSSFTVLNRTPQFGQLEEYAGILFPQMVHSDSSSVM